METTHTEIVSYWSQHQDECSLSVDWSDADKLCWRCAHKRKLHRCHIIPRALGGSNDPSNLVLLCKQCHEEAPNVVDPEFMWIWLRAHAADFYGTYWYQRGLREYELIFGSKPFAGMEKSDLLLAQLNEFFSKHSGAVGRHWGQGKLNPSTIAWLIRQVETDIRKSNSNKK